MNQALIPQPRVGDIWQYRDKRFERFMRVLEVGENNVRAEGVERGPNGWQFKPRSGRHWIRRDRFNGKHHGYTLYLMAPLEGDDVRTINVEIMV